VIGVLPKTRDSWQVGGCLRQPVSQESSLSLSQGSRCFSYQHGLDLEVLLPQSIEPVPQLAELLRSRGGDALAG